MIPVTVLFVCLGNICRSPTAEGVFRAKVAARGLTQQIEIDSAGTAAYHIGKVPDHRSQAAAAKRGYDLSQLRARRVNADDFQRFDYVLAMDNDNLSQLASIRPADARAELGLLLDYAREQPLREVPDPYYGGPRGFDLVLDLIEQASDQLLDKIEQQLRG